MVASGEFQDPFRGVNIGNCIAETVSARRMQKKGTPSRPAQIDISHVCTLIHAGEDLAIATLAGRGCGGCRLRPVLLDLLREWRRAADS